MLCYAMLMLCYATSLHHTVLHCTAKATAPSHPTGEPEAQLMVQLEPAALSDLRST